MQTAIQAGMPMDAIIWIVVAAIWGIAQLLSNAARKTRQTPRARPLLAEPESEPERLDAEAQLRAVLEAMTGRKLITPPPIVARSRPTTPTQPSTRQAAQADAPAAVAPSSLESTPELAAAPEMPARAAAFLRERAVVMPSLVLSQNKAMSLPRLAVPGTVRQTRARHAWRARLRTRGGIKQAMLSRIMLGPPRALTGL